jgi:predicted phage tail protein
MAAQKLKTVRLYGALGAKFGRIHNLAVSSASEAVRALCIVIPGFEKHLQESTCKYTIFIGKENAPAETYGHPSGKNDIRIAPIPAGSKRAGLLNVVLGVALVAVGFFTFGATTTAGMAMIAAGVAMAASGAITMLSPQPGNQGPGDGPNNRPSYGLNSPVNTTAQGNCVPVLYGRARVGGAIISGGTFSEERA